MSTNPKKKILFISSSQHFVDTFLLDFLEKIGIKNDLTLMTNFKNKNELSNNLKTIQIPIKRKISLLSDIYSLFIAFLYCFRSKPDIIVTVTPKSIIYGIFLKILLSDINRYHIYTGIVWGNMLGIKKKLFKILDRVNIYFSNKIIFDSKNQIDFFIDNAFPNKNFYLINNGSIKGVDVNKFYKYDLDTRLNLKNKYQIPPDRKVILYLGRMDKNKGIYELIQAFEKLKFRHSKILLLLVGKDEMNIDKFINSSDILYLPHTSNAEEIYNISNIFCIPSRREGFGNVVIESSACELPVIGSNIFGLKSSLINNLNGLTFNLNDFDDLVAKIEYLLKNEEICKKLGIEGRKFVTKKFNPKEVYDSLENLILN